MPQTGRYNHSFKKSSGAYSATSSGVILRLPATLPEGVLFTLLILAVTLCALWYALTGDKAGAHKGEWRCSAAPPLCSWQRCQLLRLCHLSPCVQEPEHEQVIMARTVYLGSFSLCRSLVRVAGPRYHLHITDVLSEQRGKSTCLGLHSCSGLEPGLELRFSEPLSGAHSITCCFQLST